MYKCNFCTFSTSRSYDLCRHERRKKPCNSILIDNKPIGELGQNGGILGQNGGILGQNGGIWDKTEAFWDNYTLF